MSQLPAIDEIFARAEAELNKAYKALGDAGDWLHSDWRLVGTTLTDEQAKRLGATRCTLDEIFEKADVVSLHTPDLPATRGMITGRRTISFFHP